MSKKIDTAGKTSGQIAYEWAMSQPGATESVKFDEDTGEPMTCVTIPLKPRTRQRRLKLAPQSAQKGHQP